MSCGPSQNWISWVFNLEPDALTPSSRQVLLTIAFHANDMGFAPKFQSSQIIEMAKLDEGASLKDIFDELIKKDYLSVNQFGYLLRQ
ncbi:hypothetical protein [Vibrio parahaemolyticus]|uniref:hypothetical protein n=1 Tax=Vibrio parahaemolyticus TaxID=670 RepID=UPI000C997E10|nr:hypothetical protein [Vibrio parahaemolyticus]PMS91938.1 hypothetical protein C1T06_22870 [Vibrio parahaemolyticus]